MSLAIALAYARMVTKLEAPDTRARIARIARSERRYAPRHVVRETVTRKLLEAGAYLAHQRLHRGW